MENTTPELPTGDKPGRVKRFLTPEPEYLKELEEEQLNKRQEKSKEPHLMDTGNAVFSTPKALRAHKINRLIFLFVLIVIGFHILCSLNTTYDGYSLAELGGRRYLHKHTNVQYFGVIPVWISNMFYGLYVVYGIMIVYSTTGMIAKTNKIK